MQPQHGAGSGECTDALRGPGRIWRGEITLIREWEPSYALLDLAQLHRHEEALVDTNPSLELIPTSFQALRMLVSTYTGAQRTIGPPPTPQYRPVHRRKTTKHHPDKGDDVKAIVDASAVLPDPSGFSRFAGARMRLWLPPLLLPSPSLEVPPLPKPGALSSTGTSGASPREHPCTRVRQFKRRRYGRFVATVVHATLHTSPLTGVRMAPAGMRILPAHSKPYRSRHPEMTTTDPHLIYRDTGSLTLSQFRVRLPMHGTSLFLPTTPRTSSRSVSRGCPADTVVRLGPPERLALLPHRRLRAGRGGARGTGALGHAGRLERFDGNERGAAYGKPTAPAPSTAALSLVRCPDLPPQTSAHVMGLVRSPPTSRTIQPRAEPCLPHGVVFPLAQLPRPAAVGPVLGFHPSDDVMPHAARPY
ncbi:hypothetical protein B0H19DRAFT_1075729 [Mycena capillaripes]|nr:hypothetical protein B0H19DRAFT_1075729 [Mycena capillaripes]